MRKREMLSLIVFSFVLALAHPQEETCTFDEESPGLPCWSDTAFTGENAELDVVDPHALPLDPSLYTPMPLPVVERFAQWGESGSQVVVYYPHEDREYIYEVPFVPKAPRGKVDGRPGCRSSLDQDTDSPPAEGWSDLALVPNPENYPWCSTCKLYITFPDHNFEASGILIDPLHVLTSGSNIKKSKGGAWANEVVVVPAYENMTEHYGRAESQSMWTFSEWSKNGSFSYNLGIICLDRPVGALTGYHGYLYNNDNNFFKNTIFQNPGYPHELPYNGEYMYNWYGSYDNVYTHLLEIGKKRYSGQNGSGAWATNSSGDHYVFSVLSHIFMPIWTNFTRITEFKFNNIKDFIDLNTPTSIDLWALDVQADTNSVKAGDQLGAMSYVVHNYSSTGVAYKNVMVNVYLSHNSTISTSDTKIQTHYINKTWGPKSSHVINLTNPPTIPADTPQGNYYLGVILNTSDYDLTNNDSSGQDAFPIYVEGAASLGISPISLTFDWDLGDPAPSAQTVSVTNQGYGTMDWGAFANPTWLDVNPKSGSGLQHNQSHTAEVSIVGGWPGAGVHNATVRFSSPQATNSPVDVEVIMNCHQSKWYVDASNTGGPWLGTSTAPFLTISDGIGAASNGDEVVVMPGTYLENVDFNGKDIKVYSDAGPALTVIDGGQAGSVVKFQSYESPLSLLEGFKLINGAGTLVGGDKYGGGIYCMEASPTIRGNIITECYATRGGGVCLDGDCQAAVEMNKILKNYADTGGGVWCRDCASGLSFENNVICRNVSLSGNGGGLMFFYHCNATLLNNTVAKNSCFGLGGGMCCWEDCAVKVTNSIIWGNNAYEGSEMYLKSVSLPVTVNLDHSDVKNDQASIVYGPGCDLTFGAFMIDEDPLMVDPLHGDCRLTWISPCINRGTDDGAPAEDMEGDARPFMGTTDMGADEFTGHHSLEVTGFTISVSGGADIDFHIDAGPVNAGQDYAILGSLGGTAPGTDLPGGLTLPLNWDGWTDFVLTYWNSQFFVNFLGKLDMLGQADAKLWVPGLNPVWIGVTMYYGCTLYNPYDFVTNPVAIYCEE